MPLIMAHRHLPLIFAHRGVSVEFTENTLEAFAAAGPRGADGVELDVRRTGDGALVVHHDAHLADGRALVDLDATELPGHVPTLAAALDVCAGVSVNIEIKNFPGEEDHDPDGAVAAGVVAEVRTRGIADRVIVSSFNYEDIQAVRRLAPDCPTGWLVIGVDDADTLLDHVVRDGHRALHPPWKSVDAALVAAAHERDVQVNTWTVDDPDQIVALAAMGVDTVITNDPATARSALGEAPPPA